MVAYYRQSLICALLVQSTTLLLLSGAFSAPLPHIPPAKSTSAFKMNPSVERTAPPPPSLDDSTVLLAQAAELKMNSMDESTKKRAWEQIEREKRKLKPKSGLAKFWQRIKQFLKRPRRPFSDIWSKTKSVGGASARPVANGLFIGMMGAWLVYLGEILREVICCPLTR